MPAIVLKQSAPAGKVSFKKDVDQVEPDEAKTIYHEHDDSPTLKTREGNGIEKENGTVMRTMRMSLISTCTSTRRSSRAVIVENYQPLKSNDH